MPILNLLQKTGPLVLIFTSRLKCFYLILIVWSLLNTTLIINVNGKILTVLLTILYYATKIM